MTTKIINNFNSLNSEDLSIIEGEGMIGCVAGAAGSPVLRFLTGTSVGTHTLPIVGTIHVGIWGMVRSRSWNGYILWSLVRNLKEQNDPCVFICVCFILASCYQLCVPHHWFITMMDVLGVTGFVVLIYTKKHHYS